jgi:hypothetical protein
MSFSRSFPRFVRPRHRPCWLALVWLLVVGSGVVWCQDGSARELVRSLTYQNGRIDRWGTKRGLFDCAGAAGEAKEDRSYVDALVGEPGVALRPLEDGLSSIQSQGARSAFATNAPWLLYAYGQIAGTAGSARLREMSGRAELGFLQNGLDDSIAAAMGLTSYLSPSHVPLADVGCRAPEAEDALDRFVVFWLKGDLESLKSELGPNAARDLDSAVTSGEWKRLRVDLAPSAATAHLAVGYRTGTGEAWLRPRLVRGEAVRHEVADRTALRVGLTDSAGGACGAIIVEITSEAVPGRRVRYRVDGGNVLAIMRLLSACASVGK